MTQLVRFEREGPVARLTLDSPHNRNALSSALVEQLRAIGIEVDDPAAQQQQGEDVDREDAGGEGKARENADTLQRERDAPHAAGLSHR